MTRRLFPRLGSLGLFLLLATALALAPVTAADAAWSAGASNSGVGAAATMPTGVAPTVAVGGTSVAVTWTAVTLSSGAAVAGYVVKRYKAGTNTLQVIGSACSGTIMATSCTENAVPAGTWTYTDTPVEVNWTGAVSSSSSVASVA